MAAYCQKSLRFQEQLQANGVSQAARTFRCACSTRDMGEIAAYFALVCVLILLLASLSLHVVSQVIALALPHSPDKGPRPLSRVERQIVAAETAPLPAEQASLRVVVLNAPAKSVKVLAAQIDLAEKADIRGISRPAAPSGMPRGAFPRRPQPRQARVRPAFRRHGSVSLTIADRNPLSLPPVL